MYKVMKKLTAADLTAYNRLISAEADVRPVDATAIDEEFPLDHMRQLGLVYGPTEALRAVGGLHSGLQPGLSAAWTGGASGELSIPQPHAVDQKLVDESALPQGIDAVRRMRQLLTALLAEPVALNKDDSVGVRALKALSHALGVDAAPLIRVGNAAGLLAPTYVSNRSDDSVLAASRGGLTWLASGLAEQWVALIIGWLSSPWDPTATTNIFAPGSHDPSVSGAAVATARCCGDWDLMTFYSPTDALVIGPEMVEALVAEGKAVGALAPVDGLAGAPSSPLRAFLEAYEPAHATPAEDAPRLAVEVADGLLPPTVDKLIAQADLTILAPGPLDSVTATFIEKIAEMESPGLASVWRVTEDSLRRGFDAGLSAEMIHQWLAAHVMGEVPQGLSFLVDEVARNHGSLRIGAVASYVRSDDPALITQAAELLNGAKSARAKRPKVSSLRVIAPTVAVSDMTVPKLLAALRDVGFQPVAEDAGGATLHSGADPILASAYPAEPSLAPPLVPREVDSILAHVRTLEVEGEVTSASAVETLRMAARSKRAAAVSYVGRGGEPHTTVGVPITVRAGSVVLYPRDGRPLEIPLHRVTNVSLSG
ncbi:hypothetical protein GCM10027157_08260 [Corynebacterium aquatimens]